MKKCCILMISWLLINLMAFQSPAEILAKSGVLAADEIWSGEVKITGDVVVPEGVTLTILPGTEIKTAGGDDSRSGVFEDRCEITVYGNLNILGDDDNFAILGEKESDTSLTQLPLGRTQTIVVSPYKINTEPLREEFKQFRIQYVILWTILSFSIYYAIRNRN